MKSIVIQLDVSGSIGANIPQLISGTIYFSDKLKSADRQIIIFASPGGGYSQHYFNMHNFAPSRRLLWQRVADWAEMQSRREAI